MDKFEIKDFITSEMNKTCNLITDIFSNPAYIQTIVEISQICANTIKGGNKIIIAGNGGSAADSQHIAAELVSRLCYDRPAMPAIAITTDTSALTAIGNDYGFTEVFARQLSAISKSGDIFIAISTSGNSSNIIKALEVAKTLEITTIGLTGQDGGKMNGICDYLLKIPSKDTPKIQECHILIGHILCAVIEEIIYGKEYNPKNVLFENVIYGNR